MKKTFLILNILLFAATCALTVYYDREGGLDLKALTGSGFVVLGLVNLVYILLFGRKQRGFPIWMALGLITCLAGDIVLNIEFLPGVAVFAVGHIFYIAAFGCLIKPKWQDLIPTGILFALALGIIQLVPILDFGSDPVKGLCIAYGFVISCMVGKTVSNFLQERNRVNALLMAGSCLFYFSDVMLVLCRFGDAPPITDTLCLFTYFPAQCLLAHAVYHLLDPVSDNEPEC